MANRAVWKSADRGAAFRPPRMHVEVRRSLGAAGEAGRAGPIHDWRIRPESLGWACNGRFSTASLSYQLGRNAETVERLRPEDAQRRLRIGDEVALFTLDPAAGREEWFRGVVAQQHAVIQSNRDLERFEVLAYGPELRLRGQVVRGQWNKTSSRDDEELAGGAASGSARRGSVRGSGLPAVFNAGGQPNASGRRFRLASLYDTADGEASQDRCRVFEAPGRRVLDAGGAAAVEARHWTAFDALRSVVEWVDDYEVVSPATDWDDIEDLLGETLIGEVDVQGMNLLEAIQAVLLPVGFGFALEPWAEPAAAGTEPAPAERHRLGVFSLRSPRRRAGSLPLAPVAGESASVASPQGQRALVQRVDFARDLRRAAGEVVVIGDRRRRQAILEFNYHLSGDSRRDLVCLWDTDEHDLSDWADGNVIDPTLWAATGSHTAAVFDKRYNRRGADHLHYPHAFRTFVWNEDGAFCCLGHDVPDLKDFGIGDGVNSVRRRRPVGPTLLRDEADGKVRNWPVKIQMGIDNEDLEASWLDVPDAAALPDRAGLTITRNVLAGDKDNETWRPYHGCLAPAAGGGTLHEKYGHYTYLTLLHNTLRQDGVRIRLRLIGSVECDDAVVATAARQSGSPGSLPAAKVVYAPDRFRWRQVPEGADLGLAADRHDDRDDADDALAYGETIRDACQHAIGHGSIVLRGLHRGYRPGMAVAATTGRVVDFSTDAGRREKFPVITAVNHNFAAGADKTELVLDTPLLQLPR